MTGNIWDGQQSPAHSWANFPSEFNTMTACRYMQNEMDARRMSSLWIITLSINCSFNKKKLVICVLCCCFRLFVLTIITVYLGLIYGADRTRCYEVMWDIYIFCLLSSVCNANGHFKLCFFRPPARLTSVTLSEAFSDKDQVTDERLVWKPDKWICGILCFYSNMVRMQWDLRFFNDVIVMYDIILNINLKSQNSPPQQPDVNM